MVALDGLARHHLGGRRDYFGIALGYTALPGPELTTAVHKAAARLARP